MRRSRKRKTTMLAVTLGALVVLASCSGSSDESTSPVAADAAPEAGDASSDGAASDESARGDVSAAGEGSGERPGDVELAVIRESRREVVHTARVEIHAEDVEQTIREATTIVDGARGFLFSQDAELDDEAVVTATYKVPPESFDTVLDDLSDLGEVVTRNVDSEDVTGQIVDLDARLAAARTSAERLRTLLGETGSVVELLEVERELAARDADVEALAAQLADLEARVELATITLTVTPPDEPAEEPDDDGPVGFVGALEGGWGAFLAAGSAVLVAVGYTLPFLAVAGVVALAALTVLRRRRRSVATADQR